MAAKKIIIVDSGATNATFTIISKDYQKQIITHGMSPYFIDAKGITKILEEELLPNIEKTPDNIFFYGAGCATTANKKIIKDGFKPLFKNTDIEIDTDLAGAAKGLCGSKKGVACILGTGSNSCVYNGKKITKNNPSPGFILGDEGSGSYLGKRVLQYYIYKTFDDELIYKFNQAYNLEYRQILDKIYRGEFPNKFLAGFTKFLSDNRGHFMIENILEDGISDFFTQHLFKYGETWTSPVHFTGSISWHFKDVLQELSQSYEIELGNITQNPMEGLIEYHKKQ